MGKQIATRLTCFALISAIENDLRDHILATSGDHLKDALVGDVATKAARRFTEAVGFPPDPSEPVLLLDYCDFADLATLIRQLAKQGLGHGREQDLARAIERLSPARNRVCHSRPLEPEDFPTLMELVDRLEQSKDGIPVRHLRDVRERLEADPSSVFSLEIPSYWRESSLRPLHNLPATEFDDTGFLGRHKDREALRKLLMSAHPVITVIGEGGVGKTALALRCLYDLVEDGDNQPFDAVVWVSLKTTALVTGGTREVRDSVRDVLGLLRTTTVALGAPPSGQDAAGLLNELLDYMRTFRVLLAIDNLETLTTGALRDLLVELPDRSKLLITSRVPLGEFEVRYALERLDDTTARLLIRKFAAVLNVTSLARASEEELKRYADLLFGNPLLIKWFVAAVSAGEDPALLATAGSGAFDDAVSFCFQNLFDRLSDMERRVLLTIAAARKPLSRGELVLLLHCGVPEIERALVTLSNSSMVRRPSSRLGDAFSLTSIAAAYIERLRPPDSGLVQQVTSDLGHIRRMAQADQVARAGYEYDPFSFEWKTRDELIATSVLRIAQVAEREQRFSEALKHVHNASQIAPTFSEVARVEARIRSRMGDLYRATEAYERALALAPDSARVRYFYGLFLLLDVEDLTAALEHMLEAERLDSSPAVSAGVAGVLKRLGRYSEAAEKYEQLLLVIDTVARKHRVSIRDQAADCYRRWLERDQEQGEHPLAVQHFSRSFEILKVAAERGEMDDHMERVLGNLLDEACRSVWAFNDAIVIDQLIAAISTWPRAYSNSLRKWTEVSAVYDRLHQAFPAEARTLEVAISATQPEEGEEPEQLGEIDALLGGFGFVVARDGERLYFSAKTCVPRKEFGSLFVGCGVAYKRGRNNKGACAVSVRRV